MLTCLLILLLFLASPLISVTVFAITLRIIFWCSQPHEFRRELREWWRRPWL
jgi:hypothetical protein